MVNLLLTLNNLNMVTLLLLTLNNLSCTRKYLKNIKYLNVSGD